MVSPQSAKLLNTSSNLVRKSIMSGEKGKAPRQSGGITIGITVIRVRFDSSPHNNKFKLW